MLVEAGSIALKRRLDSKIFPEFRSSVVSGVFQWVVVERGSGFRIEFRRRFRSLSGLRQDFRGFVVF